MWQIKNEGLVQSLVGLTIMGYYKEMDVKVLLIQAVKSSANHFELFMWVAVLMVLALAGGWIISGLRKYFLANTPSQSPISIFKELEKLRDSGQLSDEEYHRARNKLVAKTTGQPEPENISSQSRPQGTESDIISTDLAENPAEKAGNDQGPNDNDQATEETEER